VGKLYYFQEKRIGERGNGNANGADKLTKEPNKGFSRLSSDLKSYKAKAKL